MVALHDVHGLPSRAKLAGRPDSARSMDAIASATASHACPANGALGSAFESSGFGKACSAAITSPRPSTLSMYFTPPVATMAPWFNADAAGAPRGRRGDVGNHGQDGKARRDLRNRTDRARPEPPGARRAVPDAGRRCPTRPNNPPRSARRIGGERFAPSTVKSAPLAEADRRRVPPPPRTRRR